MLITDLLFGAAAVIVFTALIGLLFVLLWYVMPLAHRRKTPADD